MRGSAREGFLLEVDGGRRLAVSGGRIVDTEEAAGWPAVPLGRGEIRPPLVNGHDHLALNHYQRLGEPPYPSLYAWARDVEERFSDEVERGRRLPRRDALLFGALKNILGGVSRVVQHDRWSRHLDRNFPVRPVRVRVLHSLGLEPDPRAALEKEPRDRPLCMHLAEGVDEEAKGEVRRADDLGLLGPDFLGVHLVGVGTSDAERLRRSGSGLVWCPSSNLHLYGRTAPEVLFRSGIDVLLGSDSLLSGEGTLLDELRVARGTGLIADSVLEAAVGAVPARRLGLPEPSLRPGAPADVLVLRRPLLEARAPDVTLLLVDGRPRYADAGLTGLFELAGVAAEPLVVGGKPKLVAAPLGELARRVVERYPACGRILE